jgi:hypothetical protein
MRWHGPLYSVDSGGWIRRPGSQPTSQAAYLRPQRRQKKKWVRMPASLSTRW